MPNNTHAPGNCPICGATIIVWKRGKLSAQLLRVLAVADHVRTLHGDLRESLAR